MVRKKNFKKPVGDASKNVIIVLLAVVVLLSLVNLGLYLSSSGNAVEMNDGPAEPVLSGSQGRVSLEVISPPDSTLNDLEVER